MEYRFKIDGRPFGPIRKEWYDAAQDAVDAGYATWREHNSSVTLNDAQGAEIERIDQFAKDAIDRARNEGREEMREKVLSITTLHSLHQNEPTEWNDAAADIAEQVRKINFTPGRSRNEG